MLKNRVLHRAIMLVIAVVAVGFIGFVEKQQADMVCRAINISIDNQLGNYFIDEKDVMDIVTNDDDEKVIGSSFSGINLKHIEQKLEYHEFIYNAEVHKDLKGNLNVKVFQTRPVARIAYAGKADKYINHLGEIIPVSAKYTSRVMLVSGYVSQHLQGSNLWESDYGRKFMTLVEYINADSFWKAMVAQLEIDNRGNVKIYTQVGKQVLDFGQPENLESKFKRLNIFYDKILPSKGWNTYETVSVKFENQIVCE